MAKKNTDVLLTIEEIAKTINDKFGFDVLVTGDKVLPDIPRLSTGILSLDLALGGGWVANQWNEIVGVESASKTSLAYRTIAAAQQADPNFFTLFVAAEKFVPELAEAIGVDISRVWVFESKIMEEVFDLCVRAAKNRVVDLLVIDSLPALVTLKEDEKDLRDGILVSPGAKIISTFFKQYAEASQRSLTDPDDRRLTSIMINQWRDHIGGWSPTGNPQITPGGKAKNYFFFTRVELARIEWLQTVKKDNTTRIGQTVRARTIKNKAYRPQQEAQYDFYFADGAGHHKGEFDIYQDVANVALGLELFDSPRYSFGGIKIATKKEEIAEGLRAHPEVFRDLWDAALHAMTPGVFPDDDEVEVEAEGEVPAGDAP